MFSPARWLLAGALSLAAVAPALADRAPTPREAVRIERALRAAGYVVWREVELDDGHWLVEDAAAPDGSTFDVTIDPVTYRIVDVDPT